MFGDFFDSLGAILIDGRELTALMEARGPGEVAQVYRYFGNAGKKLSSKNVAGPLTAFSSHVFVT